MVQPKLASDVLRQLSPRKMLGNSFFSSNRFTSLRDNSPAGNNSFPRGFSRDRSASVKRKQDFSEQQSYADAVTASKNAELLASSIDCCSTEIAKVQSICYGLHDKINKLDLDDPMKEILLDMCNSVTSLSSAQESILTVLKDPSLLSRLPKAHSGSTRDQGNYPPLNQSGFVTLGGPFKRPRAGPQRETIDSQMLLTGLQVPDGVPNPPPNQNPDEKRFKDAVRDAERSTLLFNLDMGSFPTLNPEKMATQATKALSAMAAKCEGRQGSIPSEEAVAAIDDAMGVAKSVKFFGKATKTCRKNKDGTGGQYYTIPVKYEFKDKDTRMGVEAILRDKCKAQCATPYPPILRECIKQTIELVKEDYKDDYVRVNVDANNFCLKVSLRAQGKGSEWRRCGASIPLPKAALDVTSKKSLRIS